jgi:hypothetical protein
MPSGRERDNVDVLLVEGGEAHVILLERAFALGVVERAVDAQDLQQLAKLVPR